MQPYREGQLPKQAPPTRWYRRLRAFMVAWELRRRQERLQSASSLVEIKRLIAGHIDGSVDVNGAFFDALLEELRCQWRPRRRPFWARGVRPPLGGLR